MKWAARCAALAAITIRRASSFNASSQPFKYAAELSSVLSIPASAQREALTRGSLRRSGRSASHSEGGSHPPQARAVRPAHRQAVHLRNDGEVQKDHAGDGQAEQEVRQVYVALRGCSTKQPLEDESRALVTALHNAAVGCADPVLINSSFREMISGTSREGSSDRQVTSPAASFHHQLMLLKIHRDQMWR